jgi:hypothetical protein
MTAFGRGQQAGEGGSVRVRLHRGGHAAVVTAAAVAGAAVVLAPGPSASAAGTSAAAASTVQAAGPHLGRAVSLRLPLNAGAGTPIIESASCASASACTLAGTYTDKANVGQAMVVTRSGGHWGRALELQLPANADPGIGGLAESVSCTRAGSCVAAGNYRSNGEFEGFVATESHGAWHQATRVRLPANAGTSGASISAVSCTGPGSCVLAGNYSDSHGHVRPMAATETNGTWARASELGAPAAAGTAGRIFVISVACPGAGSCAAVGTFDDKAGHTRAMTLIRSGGRWHRGVQLILPRDAAGVPLPSIPPMSVSCSAPGTCLAVSSYRNKSGRVVPMSAAASAGTWARAMHITRVPSNAAALPSVTLTSVACTRSGVCTAAGGYALKSGGFGALIMTRSGTRWTTASQVRTPADAATGLNRIAQAKAIGCAATGFCAIGGTYRTAGSATAAMAAAG